MTWPTVREALLDAWAVLLPVDCAGCTVPDRALCDACVHALEPRPRWQELADGTRVLSALEYGGPVRSAILALKEEGRTDVAGRLAVPLGRILAQAAAGCEVLAVPTSRAAFRRRGYDPVALLLRRAGVRRIRGLRVAGRSQQQKKLGVEARAANRRGTMTAAPTVGGRRVILVDDVVTTGATLVEAARAVRAAGGVVVAAVTLASTPKRGRASP